MNLNDKLATLYTDRADINEEIERLRTSSTMHDGISSVFADADKHPERLMGKLMAAAMPTTYKIKQLEAEREWIEKQILAVLANPALGGMK